MRRFKIKPRSSATIVQQMNTFSTRDAMRSVANGLPIDIPQGSTPRTYDFDDQSKVDFEKPLFGQMSNPMYDGFENLIDQHLNAGKISEHLHPTPTPAEPTPPPADPTPPPTE